MAAEIDAAHVLSSYMSLSLKPSNTVVRDIGELPYPKDVIKLVLVHCMQLTKPSPERDALRRACLSLADFQPLSNEERTSIELWVDVGATNATNMTNEQLLNLAKKVSAGGKQGLEAHQRATEESQTIC